MDLTCPFNTWTLLGQIHFLCMDLAGLKSLLVVYGLTCLKSLHVQHENYLVRPESLFPTNMDFAWLELLLCTQYMDLIE